MNTISRTLAALLVGAVVCTGLATAGYADVAYTVGTAMIPVGGVKTEVLTDAKGMTLYYYMFDTATGSVCTSDCAKIWLPLLSVSAPTSEHKLPGELTVVPTSNGQQVAYNGHLLYTYSGDAATGQVNGQGIGGKWWVATVDLKPTSASTVPTPTGGDGGNHDGGGGGMGGY